MDLVNLFASDWGALKFLAGFVLLPFLYLRDCCDVHQSYQSFFEKLSTQGLAEAEKDKVLSPLADRLHFFNMEWWLIVAVTVLLLTVFLLGEIVQFSSLVSEDGMPHKNNGPRVETAVPTGKATPTPDSEEQGEHATAEIQRAKGLVNIFGFVVALAVVYCVHWKKADAYRTLQELARESV